MVSSDRIAASVCVYLADVCDYPIPIMCSRKTGSATQSMIIQKNHVSMLSVLINLLMYQTPEYGKESKMIQGLKYIKDIIKFKIADYEEAFENSMNAICGDLYTPQMMSDVYNICSSSIDDLSSENEIKNYFKKKEITGNRVNKKNLSSLIASGKSLFNEQYQNNITVDVLTSIINVITDFTTRKYENINAGLARSISTFDHSNYTHKDCQTFINEIVVKNQDTYDKFIGKRQVNGHLQMLIINLTCRYII